MSRLHDQLIPVEEPFFRGTPDQVARNLLGKILYRIFPDGTCVSGRICETEAYSRDDPASHSFPGLTARNAPMFGPPGRAYVYLIYGIHHCLNVVTGQDGEGSAVLIRSLLPLTGKDEMRKRRGYQIPESRLCDGPGKICQAFDINLIWNGHPLDKKPLIIGSDGCIPSDRQILNTPRIGITRNADALRRFLWNP